jgi:hypothetical protein
MKKIEMVRATVVAARGRPAQASRKLLEKITGESLKKGPILKGFFLVNNS